MRVSEYSPRGDSCLVACWMLCGPQVPGRLRGNFDPIAEYPSASPRGASGNRPITPWSPTGGNPGGSDYIARPRLDTGLPSRRPARERSLRPRTSPHIPILEPFTTKIPRRGGFPVGYEIPLAELKTSARVSGCLNCGRHVDGHSRSRRCRSSRARHHCERPAPPHHGVKPLVITRRELRPFRQHRPLTEEPSGGAAVHSTAPASPVSSIP